MAEAHKSPQDAITPQHTAVIEDQHGLVPGSVWGIIQGVLSMVSNPQFLTAIQQLIALFKVGKSATVTEVPK